LSRRLLALLAVLAVFGGATAFAQPPKPAASASAAPSALPPGHPQVPGGMPAGHPQVDDQRDQQEDETGQQQGVSDSASEDPGLPVGTVVVTVKDGDDKPVPHASVKLVVLRSTVAKGDSSEQMVREADDAGTARFDGLARGSGTSFRLSTSRGAATYMLGPFALGEKAGKRAVLHSFEATATLDNHLMVVMRAAIGVSLREDAIQVEQLVSVMNLGKTAWLADMPIQLPKGFKAFTKQDTNDDGRVDELPGTGVAIRGTFPPGERDLEFRYQVPLEGDATQALHVRLPDRVTQTRVLTEASKAMGLEVRGFPPAKRVEGRDGKRLLVTDFAARKPGEASTIDITLTNLPTQGPGRWIAVLLAVVALGSGIAYFAQTSDGPADGDARKDLAEAREALLDELVALERARKSGEVGPKTYARVRASLLDALARIVSMIEAAAPKPSPAKKRDDGKKPAPGPSRPSPKPRRRAEGSA
jgi:hypothetical protein